MKGNEYVLFQSVKLYNTGVSSPTVHPNHNIMESFNFGDILSPILCGLLCRGNFCMTFIIFLVR
jgi:hypothetical protein